MYILANFAIQEKKLDSFQTSLTDAFCELFLLIYYY